MSANREAARDEAGNSGDAACQAGEQADDGAARRTRYTRAEMYGVLERMRARGAPELSRKLDLPSEAARRDASAFTAAASAESVSGGGSGAVGAAGHRQLGRGGAARDVPPGRSRGDDIGSVRDGDVGLALRRARGAAPPSLSAARNAAGEEASARHGSRASVGDGDGSAGGGKARPVRSSSAVSKMLERERLLSDTRPLWRYLDPQGSAQGPFSAVQIISWFRQGYFGDDLPVQRSGGGGDGFRPMREAFLLNIGDDGARAASALPPGFRPALAAAGGDDARGQAAPASDAAGAQLLHDERADVASASQRVSGMSLASPPQPATDDAVLAQSRLARWRAPAVSPSSASSTAAAPQARPVWSPMPPANDQLFVPPHAPAPMLVAAAGAPSMPQSLRAGGHGEAAWQHGDPSQRHASFPHTLMPSAPPPLPPMAQQQHLAPDAAASWQTPPVAYSADAWASTADAISRSSPPPQQQQHQQYAETRHSVPHAANGPADTTPERKVSGSETAPAPSPTPTEAGAEARARARADAAAPMHSGTESEPSASPAAAPPSTDDAPERKKKTRRGKKKSKNASAAAEEAASASATPDGANDNGDSWNVVRPRSVSASKNDRSQQRVDTPSAEVLAEVARRPTGPRDTHVTIVSAEDAAAVAAAAATTKAEAPFSSASSGARRAAGNGVDVPPAASVVRVPGAAPAPWTSSLSQSIAADQQSRAPQMKQKAKGLREIQREEEEAAAAARQQRHQGGSASDSASAAAASGHASAVGAGDGAGVTMADRLMANRLAAPGARGASTTVWASQSSSKSLADIQRQQPHRSAATGVAQTQSTPPQQQGHRARNTRAMAAEPGGDVEWQRRANNNVAKAATSDAEDEDGMFWETIGSAKQRRPRAQHRGTRDDVAAAFGSGQRPSREFSAWCDGQLVAIAGSAMPDLIEFVFTLDSAEDVRAYLTEYLGGSDKVDRFAHEFVRRREFERRSSSGGAGGGAANQEQAQSGGKTNSGSGSGSRSKRRGARGRNNIVDPSLLGFQTTPGERMNSGGIDYGIE